MTARAALLKAIDKVRSVVGNPATLDLRTNTLTIRTRTWPGDRGIDVPNDSDLEILPRPLVRRVSTNEVASSGGRFEQGDLRVTAITPAYDGGGYTVDQIVPTAPDDTVEILYIVTGPNAGEYALVDQDVSKPLRYTLTLRKRRSTP